jgi:hypothetical protein
MGRSFREMRDEKCRDMENVGANRKGAEDETVRSGGRDMSVDPFARQKTGLPKHGPGFPSMEWGEDRDADSDGDYDD